VLLHHKKKFDNDFGGWPNHDLALPPFLSIVHALESIIQHTNPHHSRSLKDKSQLQSMNETTQFNRITFKKQKHKLNLTKEKEEKPQEPASVPFSFERDEQQNKDANTQIRRLGFRRFRASWAFFYCNWAFVIK